MGGEQVVSRCLGHHVETSRYSTSGINRVYLAEHTRELLSQVKLTFVSRLKL